VNELYNFKICTSYAAGVYNNNNNNNNNKQNKDDEHRETVATAHSLLGWTAATLKPEKLLRTRLMHSVALLQELLPAVITMCRHKQC
jgi:hypothetical protein